MGGRTQGADSIETFCAGVTNNTVECVMVGRLNSTAYMLHSGICLLLMTYNTYTHRCVPSWRMWRTGSRTGHLRHEVGDQGMKEHSLIPHPHQVASSSPAPSPQPSLTRMLGAHGSMAHQVIPTTWCICCTSCFGSTSCVHPLTLLLSLPRHEGPSGWVRRSGGHQLPVL